MKSMLVLVPDVRELIQNSQFEELEDILSDLHPADIAEIISELPGDEKIKLFNLIPDDRKAVETFNELEEKEQVYLLEHLSREKKAFLLNEMAPDERADLFEFEELTVEQEREFEELMSDEARREVELLTAYPRETAGGLMTTEYASVIESMTVAQAIDYLRATAPDKETIYSVYVTSEKGVLVGVVLLKDLILANPDKRISEIMDEKVINVDVNTDQEEVADIMRKYNLNVIPVVDRYRKLVGIITVDDILDVMQEEATEDMAKIAGTEVEDIETVLSPVKSARLRTPWLVLTYIGEILVSLVIAYFKPTLNKIVILASFMPLIAAMGGNTGSQTAITCVRGLATGTLELGSFRKVLFKEALTGTLMGSFYGVVIALIALVIYGFKYSLVLPLTVGIGCIASMTFASVMGVVGPFTLTRLGKDPALAAGPIISTGTDFLSITVYLSIATLLLRMLG